MAVSRRHDVPRSHASFRHVQSVGKRARSDAFARGIVAALCLLDPTAKERIERVCEVWILSPPRPALQTSYDDVMVVPLEVHISLSVSRQE